MSKHKGYGLLDRLDFDKMHETKKNKNRHCLLIFDRTKVEDEEWLEEFMEKVARAIDDLNEDKIDTLTIDVAQRTWH